MNTPAYQTIIVKFREAITELDGIFRDTQFWGVATLKEWIDDYEGSRFTAIGGEDRDISAAGAEDRCGKNDLAL